MPDSTVLRMDNPLITQSQGMAVWTQLRTLPTYYPSTVKWRGNPAVQPGDILAFEAEDGAMSYHAVASQTLHISGFYVDSESPGDAMTLDDMAVDSVLDRKLNQAMSEVEERVDTDTADLRSLLQATISMANALATRVTGIGANLTNLSSTVSDIGSTVSALQAALNTIQAVIAKQPVSGIYTSPVTLTGTPCMATLLSGGQTLTIPPDGQTYQLNGCDVVLDGQRLDISTTGALPDIRYTIYHM